jgi:ribonuclease P protein component
VTAATSRRFGKDRKLRRRGEFQRVFDKGHRIRGQFFTLLVTLRDSNAARPRRASRAALPLPDAPRLGIVASKKLGDAVRRNRAKRLIREVFRLSQNPGGLEHVDIVVIPNSGIFEASFTNLEQDYRNLLSRGAARLVSTRTNTHGRS